MKNAWLLLALAVPLLAGEGFRSARPVWPEGRESEMNLTVAFRAGFDAQRGEPVRIRLAASTVYRLSVNGKFRGYGPARGPHGFYRVDVVDLGSALRAGRNEVKVEVAGYNVNTYYTLDQPSFLQAEVFTDAAVLAATGAGAHPFIAAAVNERVQKVQRYSFQRPFSEMYRLPAAETPVKCAVVAEKRLIPRRVPYPKFAERQPVRHVSSGAVETGVAVAKPWKDRSLTGIGKDFSGYREGELAALPSIDLQHLRNMQVTALGRTYAWTDRVALGAQRFHILDFGTNLSGFIGARMEVKKAAKIYLTFDEMLQKADVNFRRLGCVNAVVYELQPGTYSLESFEPYTLRYLKATVLEGEATFDRIYLREYVNPDVWQAHFSSSDSGLNRLFAAGRETYQQNAVDLFSDCPSRERAGWLCDSFFTARVEPRLTGRSPVEHAFLENFLLPDSYPKLPDGMLPMCYPADHTNGNFIPNWSLWFVLELEEYLERSGDRATIAAARPKVTKLIEFFHKLRNEDGLLEKLPAWVFVEWSAANKFVQDVNYPSNMLYAGALDAAARLYGNAAWRDEAAKVRETVRKQSFDGEFFVDNAVRKDGKVQVTRNRTETCQYYAFFFEVATPQSHPKLWTALRDGFGPDRKKKGGYPEIHAANAFIGNTLRLELLAREGLTRQLIAESRAYLLYMAERTGTLWENINEAASLNHGFASHVVNVLYRDALGLYRVNPRAKTVTLRFTDSPLDWCEGRVPVPGGAVSLRWDRNAEGLVYFLEAPAGYTVEVQNRSGKKAVPGGVAGPQ